MRAALAILTGEELPDGIDTLREIGIDLPLLVELCRADGGLALVGPSGAAVILGDAPRLAHNLALWLADDPELPAKLAVPDAVLRHMPPTALMEATLGLPGVAEVH